MQMSESFQTLRLLISTSFYYSYIKMENLLDAALSPHHKNCHLSGLAEVENEMFVDFQNKVSPLSSLCS